MLSPDSHLYSNIKSQFPEYQLDRKGMQAQTYWGDQPFTSGPVYFGAIICFLFVLGMIIIKSRFKWVFFASTIFFIFLSWGHNFELFNDWFFFHFPMYNKFRAVSTALVIPAITIVIIAILGLSELSKRIIAKENIQDILKATYISAGITGGICLLLMIVPRLFGFDFISGSDSQWTNSVPEWYYKALISDRQDLLFYDAFRSLIFIALAAITIIFITKSKTADKKILIKGGVALLILLLIDLWSVDKRYLDNDKFQNKITASKSNFFEKTTVDRIILEDKELSYRVLNLDNPFNETRTSYFHKSIGGYHAAKLKRYQELIDYNIQYEINDIIKSFETQNIDSITNAFRLDVVLNMLNTKYIIFSTEQPPLVNPYAMGNGWFVKDFNFVNSADDEIASLKKENLYNTAIINKKFENELVGLNIQTDSTATLQLVEYQPNKLKYKSNSQTEQLAVFSEIYYPKGWVATIDGKPTSYFGADWVLRAMRVPAGSHDIEFKFAPHDYNLARLISSIFSGLLFLCVICGIIICIRKITKSNSTTK